jgi:hypothetical protein
MSRGKHSRPSCSTLAPGHARPEDGRARAARLRGRGRRLCGPRGGGGARDGASGPIPPPGIGTACAPFKSSEGDGLESGRPEPPRPRPMRRRLSPGGPARRIRRALPQIPLEERVATHRVQSDPAGKSGPGHGMALVLVAGAPMGVRLPTDGIHPDRADGTRWVGAAAARGPRRGVDQPPLLTVRTDPSRGPRPRRWKRGWGGGPPGARRRPSRRGPAGVRHAPGREALLPGGPFVARSRPLHVAPY